MDITVVCDGKNCEKAKNCARKVSYDEVTYLMKLYPSHIFKREGLGICQRFVERKKNEV